MKKVKIDEVVCINCNLCLTSCPTMILKKGPDGITVTDIDSCDGCGDCVGACPTEAITLEEEE